MGRLVSGRIFLFGDSHIQAIKEALDARGSEGTALPMEARRLLKSKRIGETAEPAPLPLFSRFTLSVLKAFRSRNSDPNVVIVGDTTFEDGMKLAGRLKPEDVFVCVIGGNQHAVFSTIRHPVPFDFVMPDHPEFITSGPELIPYRTLYGYFLTALRDGDGQMIAALRRSTSARMFHLVAPPPKRDNNWIEQHHDTLFASEGIASSGVSEPALRMKFWHLQNDALAQICGELGIELIGPPSGACDEFGFLLPEYYAGDATHANPLYGELVLRQLEEMFQSRRKPTRMAS